MVCSQDSLSRHTGPGMITVTRMHTSNTIFRSPVFILRSERTNGANRTNDRPADRQAMPYSGLRRKETSKSFAVYSSEPVRMAHRASSRSEYIHLYDGGSANNPCSADTDAPTIR